MLRQTKELIDRLSAADWFAAVGADIDDGEVIIVHSWKEAIDECTAQSWEDATLDAHNEISESLAESIGLDRFGKVWNETVIDIQKYTKPLTDAKIADVAFAHQFPKRVTDMVRWVVTGACLECEFAEWVSKGFFLAAVNWHLIGHFPCGWKGDYPDGKLIVF